MKRIIFLTSTIFFYLTNLYSQSLSGKKVFSVSIGTVSKSEFNSATIYSSGSQKIVPLSGHSVRSEFSFGKINTNNQLIGGGIGLTNVLLTMDTTNGIVREASGISYFAFFVIQKYKLITKRLYYTPSLIAGPEFVSYSINDELNSRIIQSNFSAGGIIRVRPVSFAFSFSLGANTRKKIFFATDIGEISLSHRGQKSKSYTVINPNQKRQSSESVFLLGFPVAVRLSLSL